MTKWAITVAALVGSLVSPFRAGADPPIAQTSVPAPDTGARSMGARRCRFEKPAAWTSGGVTWLGGCRAGFAEGYGVIVNTGANGEIERFFGRLERGYIRVGVLRNETGFMAGIWANGALAAPLPDDLAQRNSLIAAFDVAATAASTVSRLCSKRSDDRTSRFYAKQARLLRAQMD